MATLSEIEQQTLALTYNRRTAAQLRTLAQVMGLATDGTKAQLIARLVGNAVKVDIPQAPAFDMTGLVIHCAPGAFNA